MATPSKKTQKKQKEIVPLGDRVLVAPDSRDEDRTTDSGIIIPETASQERPVTGKVLAVGEGRRNEDGSHAPLSVKKGDTVLFKKFGPDEVSINDEEYLVVSESDILAVIK